MNHYNELTPAELELLAHLSEECGEIISIIGKIMRHGYSSVNPDDPEKGSNRVQLENEILDMRRVLTRMYNANHLQAPWEEKIYYNINNNRWYHHQIIKD